MIAVGGYFIPCDLLIRETLNWLDARLGGGEAVNFSTHRRSGNGPQVELGTNYIVGDVDFSIRSFEFESSLSSFRPPSLDIREKVAHQRLHILEIIWLLPIPDMTVIALRALIGIADDALARATEEQPILVRVRTTLDRLQQRARSNAAMFLPSP